MRILLEFESDSSPVQRARISYAFRLFCAIYGHTPLLGEEPAGAVHLRLSLEVIKTLHYELA